MIDLAVVGGGPAGLATALQARRAGLSVVVFEPRPSPIDKACGEGLMPGAVADLRHLGVRPDGFPFSGIRYLDRTRSATAPFPGGRHGLGVARTELHRCLRAAAERDGVLWRDERVAGVLQDAEGVTLAGIRSRYVVAADGLHSAIRRGLGMSGPVSTHRRWGIRARFALPPWDDRVQVHWADEGEAYVTPLAANLVGVAVLTGRQQPFIEQLERFPMLRERLADAEHDEPRAAGPLRQTVTARTNGRVLLVGDAAGYVDALTGEGLAIAFRCAAAAVARIVEGRPARYEHDYLRITRRYRAMTHTLLAAGRSERARPLIVPAATRMPFVFRRAVAALAANG
ncbi:NAD(P)/FAD-dependent oxidoreductase [Jatrophihabitans telluris]|uniref:NAD(P)/FAD-dependent oxidoreductase n=1 Tax=Jatrophihabitans telluris TaxID=2038343 RepID=A0ABY4QZZ6_9ACTN|nr:NAD(P)/FAD-dependent oxidoreductase [Jatrophihabitans telluris]UQX89164.1 NAD(P)/FAD-dependent oxidoreductase [Jatrophihabitans telluris]